MSPDIIWRKNIIRRHTEVAKPLGPEQSVQGERYGGPPMSASRNSPNRRFRTHRYRRPTVLPFGRIAA